MRLFKQLMLVGVLAGILMAAVSSSASAQVPCGFSWTYTETGRYGWNMNNCSGSGVNWRVVYHGAVGECYYIPPHTNKVGSSQYQPNYMEPC